jgi:uncharacterized protein YxeA
MRRTVIFSFALMVFIFFSTFSCQNKKPNEKTGFVKENVDFADQQYGMMTRQMEDSGKILNPR